MATFAELVADVKIITNRPDLDAEIKLAVKAATLKAHHTDFYPKDLYDLAIIWSPVAFIQALDYTSLVPRYRSFKYLRKYDPANTDNPGGVFFTMITPEQAVDAYNLNKDNVCYVAGTNIEIRSSTQDTYMLFGCYIHPDITEGTYDSWIARNYPYAIEFEAAAKIFKQIGWDEQSAEMRREVAEQFILLRNSEIQGQGY